MDEMVERVTKAILDAMDIADALDGTAAETYARAAIEAMLEPTDKMILDGNDAATYANPVEVWNAMIKAAIKPPICEAMSTSPPNGISGLTRHRS